MEPITNQNIHNRDWSEQERKRALREITLQVDYEDARSAFFRFLLKTRMLSQEILEKGLVSAVVAYWLRATPLSQREWR